LTGGRVTTERVLLGAHALKSGDSRRPFDRMALLVYL
jgi:hypothetical protein